MTLTVHERIHPKRLFRMTQFTICPLPLKTRTPLSFSKLNFIADECLNICRCRLQTHHFQCLMTFTFTTIYAYFGSKIGVHLITKPNLWTSTIQREIDEYWPSFLDRWSFFGTNFERDICSHKCEQIFLTRPITNYRCQPSCVTVCVLATWTQIAFLEELG